MTPSASPSEPIITPPTPPQPRKRPSKSVSPRGFEALQAMGRRHSFPPLLFRGGRRGGGSFLSRLPRIWVFRFDKPVQGKLFYRHAGTRGEVVTEHFGISGVYDGEIGHINDNYRHFHNIVDRCADFFKQSEDILEALFCLSLYATPSKLPRGRIDPQLAREINGVFGSGCLGIRANGCRGFGCTDDFVPLG